MSHHDHDHDDPIIWEVLDESNKRLTMLVKHTYEEALAQAKTAFPSKQLSVLDTGKRKPQGKCCNKCGNVPCGSI